jgi:prolyl-tRNA synthetase
VTAVCDTKDIEVVRSLGARDVLDRSRDNFTKDAYTYDVIFDVPRSGVEAAIDGLLVDVQASLFRTARDARERRTLREPGGYREAVEYLRDPGGFVAASWCGRRECEARVKDESSATIRCLPLAEQPPRETPCICCGREAVAEAVWAQAY